MTVILVLATFLIFILLDYLLNRKKVVKTLPRDSPHGVARAGPRLC